MGASLLQTHHNHNSRLGKHFDRALLYLHSYMNFMLDRSSKAWQSQPMNRLSAEKRAHIVGMLVEGNSLRAVSRLADVSINTVTKLLVDVGCAAAEYQDKTLR